MVRLSWYKTGGIGSRSIIDTERECWLRLEKKSSRVGKLEQKLVGLGSGTIVENYEYLE